MANWFEHKGAFYNLDKFTQIVRGEENEILLTTLPHNGDWEDVEEQICSLKFDDKDDMGLAFMRLIRTLGV